MNKKRNSYSYGHGLNIRSYLCRLFICTSTLAYVGTSEGCLCGGRPTTSYYHRDTLSRQSTNWQPQP